MDTSLFLAKLLGPLLIVTGLGVLFSRAAYREAAEEVLKSRALLYLFGAIGFAAGLGIVLTHNVWVWGWPVIITILGWFILIRGTLRILIPQQVGDLGAKIMARSPNLLPVRGVVVIVFGAVLSWMGYACSNP
jgi:uncharacterized protein YjeT (DUF2065 family)